MITTRRSAPEGPQGRRSGYTRRSLLFSLILNVVIPVIAYTVVRPYVNSDAFGLAVAGAIPALANIGTLFWRRRVDIIAVVALVGFGLACLTSVLLGGSSLPLKLHTAALTFLVGFVLLVAVLFRHPIPLGRALRLPNSTTELNATLSIMVGAFLVLHALIHLALALTLSTASFNVASRIVSWAMVAVGAGSLWIFVRRIRRKSDPRADEADSIRRPGARRDS